MVNVEECVKLQERKSLVEIFFPSLQINTMDHLPDHLLAPSSSTLRKKKMIMGKNHIQKAAKEIQMLN